MHFDLSKPQKLFAQSVRDFCDREFPPERVRELMETEAGVDDRLWQEFADQGWLGLHIDEDHEGLGLGTVDLAVLAEEFGRCCAPGPWFGSTWAATLLQAIGGSAAVHWLPKIINGETKFSVAALESGATWNLCADHLESKVVDGVLHGHKTLVLNAGQADRILLPAKLDTELAVLVIDTARGGVRMEKTPGVDPTRTLYHLDFESVEIDDDDILISGQSAMAAWQVTNRTMTIVAAAEMLGGQDWMLTETVEYAKTRQQFGKTIGSFQAVQHMCADMLQLTESARAAVWYAAWAVEQDTDDANHAVSVAKAYTSDAARRTGNLAIQTHGGIGFTWEHDLHLYYKRAKANELLLGDCSFHREKLAASVLD